MDFTGQPHLPCTTGQFGQYNEKKRDFPLKPIKTSLPGKVLKVVSTTPRVSLTQISSQLPVSDVGE